MSGGEICSCASYSSKKFEPKSPVPMNLPLLASDAPPAPPAPPPLTPFPSVLVPVVADAQVQDLLLHARGDVSNSSQGMWLQQTCTLFVQSGVRLLTEFTQHAAAWANASVVRANFSQPHRARSHRQPERSGHSQVGLSSSSHKTEPPEEQKVNQ
ncbi:hypothetical protein F2P81_021483 [Scophthalmus maximus]|uniref:Uncharacterized protein n=1 Tax=Scophthalmus maximus TaxID=52904 RepID=A0A6A4RVH0_SCOMX|nr:hypothetical protein F2P81_021483 [Scophthalmus maximus]